jgi:hypothetical protein
MPTISVKEAVGRAKSALKDLYEDDPPRALALEEIELVGEDDRQLWAVTLGFQRRREVTVVPNRNSIQELLGQTPATEVEHRVYKTVLIDANSGDFVKMDIRQVQ